MAWPSKMLISSSDLSLHDVIKAQIALTGLSHAERLLTSIETMTVAS